MKQKEEERVILSIGRNNLKSRIWKIAFAIVCFSPKRQTKDQVLA